MAADLCPRLRAFVASSRSLLAARSVALPLPLRRDGPAMLLAARARRGLGSSSAAAPLAEDFATASDLRFESPLEVVKYPDPVLRVRNKRINTFDAKRPGR